MVSIKPGTRQSADTVSARWKKPAVRFAVPSLACVHVDDLPELVEPPVRRSIDRSIDATPRLATEPRGKSPDLPGLPTTLQPVAGFRRIPVTCPEGIARRLTLG